MIQTTSLAGFSFRYSHELNNDLADTIVFVGGTFQSIETINKPFKLWPEKLNSIIIELPGFGQSNYLPLNYDMQFYVDCIEHVVKLINVKKRLIGYSYSYGSGPLYQYVTQNSKKFKCFIAGGASTRFSPKVKEEVECLIELAERQDSEFKTKFIETFVNPDLPKKIFRKTSILLKCMLKTLTPEDLKCFAVNHKRLLREQKQSAINFIKVPTMALIGEYDRFINFSDMENLDHNFSKFHAVRLDDCDHFYNFQTDHTLELTTQFIARNQDIGQPNTQWGDIDLNAEYLEAV